MEGRRAGDEEEQPVVLATLLLHSSEARADTVACKRVGVFRNFRVQAKKSKNNSTKR